MHSMIFRIVAVAGFASMATAVPGELITRATTCKTPSGSGLCSNTATACGGVYLAGYCPGASNIQCCVTTPIKCSTPYGGGLCGNTDRTCGGAGVYLPGYCPGNDDVQCCVSTPIKCETPDGNGLCGDTDKVCGNGNGFYSAGYCPGPNDVQCCVATPPDPPASDEDGEDGATLDNDPHVNDNIVPDPEVIADLIADGLDGDFDDDGNPINTRDVALSPRAAKTKGQLIYAAAAKQLGVPYKFGGGNCAGKTKGGFDCSGLVLHAVCKVTRKTLPHKASAQYTSAKGRKVKWANKQQGDAIFWGCGSGIYHVGIVKNSTHFINAPHTGAKVRVQKYWGTPCKSAVRFW